jgi:hypothetical protein
MLTPETALEIGRSACVIWRAQPPLWMRLWALLKEAQNCDMSPTSVAGGLTAFGNCDWRAGFCGPGSLRPPGLLLTAPSGGSSGLPNVAACAEPAASNAPPAAAVASTSRRERKRIARVAGTASSAVESGNLLIVTSPRRYGEELVICDELGKRRLRCAHVTQSAADCDTGNPGSSTAIRPSFHSDHWIED